MSSDTSELKPTNKEEIQKIHHKLIPKSCPVCDIIVEAKDCITLVKNLQKNIASFALMAAFFAQCTISFQEGTGCSHNN